MKTLVFVFALVMSMFAGFASTMSASVQPTSEVREDLDYYATINAFILSAYPPGTTITAAARLSPGSYTYTVTSGVTVVSGTVTINLITQVGSLYQSGIFVKNGIVEDELEGF